MAVKTRVDRFNFRGGYVLGTSKGEHPFIRTITGAAPPTCTIGDDGCALALTAAEQVQNVCLSMGDVLPYDIDDLIRVEMLVKAAALGATVTAVVGLGSARNDAPDSVAANAWFRMQGSNALLCETDDGTNDNDDKAAGITLSTTFKRLAIDFASGVKTQSKPSASTGGKAAVQFFAGNANGSLRKVADATAFDMSNYASGLQLIAQISKTSSTDTGSITILEFEVEYKLPA